MYPWFEIFTLTNFTNSLRRSQVEEDHLDSGTDTRTTVNNTVLRKNKVLTSARPSHRRHNP